MNRRVHWSVLVAGCVALTALALAGGGRLWGQGAEAPPISIAGSEPLVYVLEFQGQFMGEYTDCAGLGSYHELEERATVTPTGSVVVQKAPGALQWHKIILKRSTPSQISVWQWRKTMETMGLAASLRDGGISLYKSGSMQPVAQWSFTRAWPAALVFNGSEEELVIVHEGLTLGGTISGGGTASRTR